MILSEYWRKEIIIPGIHTSWERIITLAEINLAINRKMITEKENSNIVILIEKKLPRYLTNLTNFFNKKDSNILPLLRKNIDMEIELIEPLSQRVTPLYKITLN